MKRLLLLFSYLFLNISLIAQNNTVVTWGNNIFNKLDIPADLDSIIEITAGMNHSLALKSNGTVVAWGRNHNGQTNVPPDLDSVIAIEAGLNYSLALKNNSTVIVWGHNPINTPTNIDSVRAISSRLMHVLVLKMDSTVAMWGEYSTQGADFVTPPNLDSVIAIAAGSNHSLALKSNGTVVAWGDSALIKIPEGLDSVIAIAAGFNHSTALKNNGSLVSWGAEGFNQQDIPEKVHDVIKIANGTNRSIVLKNNGDIITWIRGGRIQQLPQCLQNVKSIAAGVDYYIALTNPSFFATVDTHSACNNYTWIDGKTYTANNDTATYTYIAGGINGCDSTVRLDLTINNTIYHTDTQTTCGLYTWIDGNTYISNNNTATYTFVGGASTGCDSVVRLNLTILNKTHSTDTQAACSMYTWMDGYTYASDNNTAIHTISNGASNGCDSVITLDLTILNNTQSTDPQFACGLYTWIDGNTYASSNNTAIYTITDGANNGCDSIVTLDLTIINSEATDTQTACNRYTWLDGITYTESNNTATHTIVGGATGGCDSLITLDLTIINTNAIDVQFACNSYIWIDGITYTEDNNTATYTITEGASSGCDSIITLDLTVVNSEATDIQTACVLYTWIDGNTYASSNNTATHIFVNGASRGCDSIIHLDLTIKESVTNIAQHSACNSYTWIDGNTYASSNNTATYSIYNGASNGCDSIITLDLTVNTIDASITQTDTSLIANTTGESYQWLDCENNYLRLAGETSQSFDLTQNGAYALEVSNATCTDTSACIPIIGENTLLGEVTIYPNPSDGFISLVLGNLKDVSINVINVNGQSVYYETGINATIYEIELDTIPGFYIIEVSSQGEQAYYKLVVKE